MTLTEEQIEWIVAEVVRRLKTAGVAEEDRSTSADAPQCELKVTERVVTMRTIETRLLGVKRVIVQPRAVVTPAVKDELKQKKIELVVEQN